MNRDDAKKIIKVLMTAYPKYYPEVDRTPAKIKDMVDLYAAMFAEYEEAVVAAALKIYIKNNVYPPTIAGLNLIIENMCGGHDELPNLWSEAWKAICGDISFEDLSPENKAYFKSQHYIDEIGQSEDTVESVERGIYMRQMPAVKERMKVERETPAEILELAKAATKTIGSLPELGGGEK